MVWRRYDKDSICTCRRWILSRALSSVWWLLALCGVLDATHAGINLLMLDPSLTLRTFGLPGAVWDMGILALVTGICAIGAGLWSVGRIIPGCCRCTGLRWVRSE